MSRTVLIAAATSLFAASISQAAYFDNFENTGSLAANYNQADTTAANTFQNVSTSPTIGTNSIKAQANNTLTYKGGTFALAKGESITSSVYVAQRTASSNSNVLVQLGFGDKATDTFNNGSGFVSIFSRLINDNTTPDATTYHLASDNKATSTAAAGETSAPSTVNLTGGFGTSGHPGPLWYLYSVTLTRTDINDFKLVSSLQYVGTAGTETPTATPVITYTSGTYTNAAMGTLATNGTLYAAIRSNTNSGALRLDNFSVSDPVAAPEPASLGLLGVGALLLGKRRRRA